MLTKLHTIELLGIHGKIIDVEVNVAKGQPRFSIIGLTDTAIQESTVRIRTALKNCDMGFPYTKSVIVNLAPADMRKEGPRYDMSIVMGILLSSMDMDFDISDTIFAGEVSFDGTFRSINGVLSIVDCAKKEGFKEIFIPKKNEQEASLISGITIYPVSTLQELISHFIHKRSIKPIQKRSLLDVQGQSYEVDVSMIKGQQSAKRALEVAAAGMHNIRMSGPPGSGKTMLARSLPSILPDMTEKEMIEVTKIYSIANLLHSKTVVSKRPFRSPHHSSSATSLIGGGRNPKPGEISLAHRGVLFLDEFPEFPRLAIETLRQPLEDGYVSISRVESSVTYPSQTMLVASQNPCPCGYATDVLHDCSCSPAAIERYKQKISGPMLDRIDIHIEVPRIPIDELESRKSGDSSESIRKRVQEAHMRQWKRFKNEDTLFNSGMNSKQVEMYCKLDNTSKKLLQEAMQQFNFSARSYYRILKVARTIADIRGSELLTEEDISESLQYRI